jgi:hypothetical protein
MQAYAQSTWSTAVGYPEQILTPIRIHWGQCILQQQSFPAPTKLQVCNLRPASCQILHALVSRSGSCWGKNFCAENFGEYSA